jgi:hypothetical protein
MTKRAILDMGLASVERGLNRIQPTSVGGDKPHLTKKRNFVEMTALWKAWKSLSTHFQDMEEPADFSTLPTMPWKSLRLFHIPTKSTVTFGDRF